MIHPAALIGVHHVPHRHIHLHGGPDRIHGVAGRVGGHVVPLRLRLIVGAGPALRHGHALFASAPPQHVRDARAAAEADQVGGDSLEQAGNIRAALFGPENAAVKPDLKQGAVARDQLLQLPQQQVVQFFPIQRSVLAGAEIGQIAASQAVIQARLDAVFMTGLNELPHHVPGNGGIAHMIIMHLGGPEAEARSVLGRQQSVPRPCGLGRAQPLIRVQLFGIPALDIRDGVAEFPFRCKDLHIKMEKDPQFALVPFQHFRRRFCQRHRVCPPVCIGIQLLFF